MTSRLVGLLLCAGVAACGDDGPEAAPATTPAPTVVASPSAAPDEQALALGQYRAFWQQLTPISRLPVAQRRPELAKLAVDPALKSLLAGMVNTDSKGQVFYGSHIPRATKAPISPDGVTALVDDCQDSTKTGLAKKSDMSPVTVGVARNHVVVTMKRQAGDLWKVAFVSYTKTPC